VTAGRVVLYDHGERLELRSWAGSDLYASGRLLGSAVHTDADLWSVVMADGTCDLATTPKTAEARMRHLAGAP
jgi:hypothetical protein